MRWLVLYIIIQLSSAIRTNDLFPYIDYSVHPCDDFYKYACGNFEKVNPMPEGLTIWDGFQILQSQVDEQLKDLLEGDKDKTDTNSFTKARTMYGSCMDTEKLDEMNVSPMYKILKGWPRSATKKRAKPISWNKIAEFVAKYGLHFIFKLTVRADMLNATRTSIYIERDDLSLPSPLLSKTIQVLDNDFSSRMDSEFTVYLTKIMTTLLDYSKEEVPIEEIIDAARTVNEFMIILRDSMSLDYGEEADEEEIVPMVGSTTIEKLQKWSDGVLINFTDTIHWQSYIRAAFKKSKVTVDENTPIFITNRSLLRKILIYVHETDRELLEDFVYSRLATFMAPESSADLRNASMEFYVNRGYIPINYPRWKYCLHKVLEYPKIGLSFAVAQKYRERYVDELTITRAKRMITNLREALKELIEQAEWMDEETRNYAIYKLENILILTGSPDYLMNRKDVDKYYKMLKIGKNDHLGNMNRIRSFGQSKNFETLATPRDRTSWSQSPMVVNAYYNGLNNRILFPISMMTPPFFSPNATSFLDYARIGAIMGHELTHAFDSHGRQLDSEGSKVSWWSESTGERYTNKTDCFVKQYNNYIMEETNFTVNGEITLAENIADNVGLRAAFKAYEKVINTNFNSYFDNETNFSANQTFFLAYASMWCRIGQTLAIDNHAPNKYRVIGPVENMASFYEAWNCKTAENTNETTNNVKTENERLCILW